MSIPGYKLTAVVCDAGELVLHQATRVRDGQPVLLKFPNTSNPTPSLLGRLEQEYEIARDLDPTRIARPLGLERNGGTLVLVLEPGPSRTLAALVGRPMDAERFLQTAFGLTACLAELHRHDLVHKDLKPENVLLDVAGHVWLTGLGIASRLPRERLVSEPPALVAGTLAYMAPEQTGRMNRSIDSRSDLYALGVTFYQMLTGVLPFAASDPMEWFHCHIARQPVPPSQRAPSLPALLSEIVMKLLSKGAEDRYQSAAGLEADLRRFQAEWQSNGRLASFPLGTQDLPGRLLIPEKLYGRRSEINELLAAFDHVVAGARLEFVLISGYSGSGKTSLVGELHKAMVSSRGLFGAGKFDPFKRDIPYATLVEALRMLIRQILGGSEAEVGEWRSALQKAVSPNGQIIIGLIPEVELFIGKQPPVQDLPPKEALNRFQRVLLRFLGVFAKAEHPCVLFLDDLQWLDTATLELINHFTTESALRHFLLVGAYRNNEVTPAHPLMQTLELIRRAGTVVREIELAPLAVNDLGCLIADSLHCELERTLPLAQLVHEKTGGNPFFAIQFLTTLTEEKLLAFDPGARAWTWDLAGIHGEGYTDNVVDLMAGKLDRLPSPTQEALKHFACLGNTAKIATLSLVCGQSEELLRADLWEALRAGLVVSTEHTCRFLHDRVQEAAYALIPEAGRPAMHLKIGRLRLSQSAPTEVAESIFEIVNHFNHAVSLISSPAERRRIAELNLVAGRGAKRSTAYASARAYLAAGMALLEEMDWSSQYPLMFHLWLERAECEFLTGNLDLAGQLIEELLSHATSKLDQAAVYHLKVQWRVVKSESTQAVNSALTCLHLFGIDLPAHPSWEQVQAEYETVWRNLNGRPIGSLIDLPLMTDPELLAAMQLLGVLLGPAYFTDFYLLCLLLCRMVNTSLRHGVSGASAHSFAWLGTILGPAFHRYREGYSFAKLACDLLDKHDFLAYQARINAAMGMVAVWTQPLEQVIDRLRTAVRGATETGDLSQACYSRFHLIAGLLLRNDPLDAVWRESEAGLDFVRHARFRDVADTIVGQQRFIAAMQGRTLAFASFSDAQFEEAAFEAQLTEDRMPTMRSGYWILKEKARFLAGDYLEALAAADRAKPLLWASSDIICARRVHLLDFFFYTALTIAALHGTAADAMLDKWRGFLAACREQLREWAESCPPTFGDKYALVSAEMARIEGRDLDAMHLYEQAIQLAQEQGFVQNEGLAHEQAARFYATRGFTTISRACLREARACYARWGAEGKVRQMEQCYPQLRESAPITPTATFSAGAEQFDLLAVVAASRAISGAIVLEDLFETLMRVVLENAGAPKGCLLLHRGEELSLAAEAHVEKQNVVVRVHKAPGLPAAMFPASILNYVRRSRDKVLLDDATGPHLYSGDDYFSRQHPRSVLCFPITRQARLVGLLYLENDLATRAFTPERLAVLELLAAQTAISLENALVYDALRESEAKYRQIVDTANEGIWAVGPDLTTTFVNARMAGMLGYSGEEMIGRPFTDFMFSEDASDHLKRRENGRQLLPEDYERRFRRKDGQTLWVLVATTPTYDDDRHFLGTFGMATDITERKRMEEALRNVLRHARTTIMHAVVTAPDGWDQHEPEWGALDYRWQSRFEDEETAQMVVPLELLPGEDYVCGWARAKHHDDEVPMALVAARALVSGAPGWHQEFRAVDRHGQVHWLMQIAFIEVMGPGRWRVTTINTDITERKQAEEVLHRLNLELDQRVKERTMDLEVANQELESFSYSVSHDLRAPLRSIDGFSRALLEDYADKLDEEGKEHLQTVRAASQRMGQLIDDMLRLSRINRGEMQWTEVDLSQMAGQVAGGLKASEPGREAEFVIAPNCVARGDSGLLRIALENGLGNAWKYTGKKPSARIEFGRTESAHGPAYFIRDNGCGFDMKYAHKLFGAFQRLHGAGEFPGNGIGLASVQRVIHRHGGQVWIEGILEQGTTLYFTLPKRPLPP
jgi:PAS domain S-box-containing protein